MQLLNVSGWEKRQPASIGVEGETPRRKKFGKRESATDIAQFSPIPHEIDNAVWQDGFEKSLQTGDCAAASLSSAKMRRPAAVCNRLATTIVRVLPRWLRA